VTPRECPTSGRYGVLNALPSLCKSLICYQLDIDKVRNSNCDEINAKFESPVLPKDKEGP
jgi:hypothetical protein